jgi:hypothetical protein
MSELAYRTIDSYQCPSCRHLDVKQLLSTLGGEPSPRLVRRTLGPAATHTAASLAASDWLSRDELSASALGVDTRRDTSEDWSDGNAADLDAVNLHAEGPPQGRHWSSP